MPATSTHARRTIRRRRIADIVADARPFYPPSDRVGMAPREKSWYRLAPMTERADTLAGAAGPADARGLRVALSPYLFQGMLLGMAAVAIGLAKATGSRTLAWRFAKAR